MTTAEEAYPFTNDAMLNSVYITAGVKGRNNSERIKEERRERKEA